MDEKIYGYWLPINASAHGGQVDHMAVAGPGPARRCGVEQAPDPDPVIARTVNGCPFASPVRCATSDGSSPNSATVDARRPSNSSASETIG